MTLRQSESIASQPSVINGALTFKQETLYKYLFAMLRQGETKK